MRLVESMGRWLTVGTVVGVAILMVVLGNVPVTSHTAQSRPSALAVRPSILTGAMSPQLAPQPATLGRTWLPLNAPGGPTPRSSFAYAWDPALGGFVIFGGCISGDAWTGACGISGETWAYVNGQWENLTGPGSPSARQGAYLVYDPPDGGLLLFGGITGTTASTCVTDTWLYGSSGWSQLTPSTTPGCTPSGMVFDGNLGHPLLLAAASGGDLSVEANVTWEFTGGNWVKLSALSNLWRGNPFLVYDSTDAETVLFGGFDIGCGCQNLGDTWIFRAGFWSQISPAHSPSARTYGPGTDDPAGGGALMFGGHYTTSFYNDTWLFHGGDWTQQVTPVAPSVRWAGGMATDPTNDRVFLFGGFNYTGSANNYPGDLWSYDFISPITSVSLAVAPPSIHLGQEAGFLTAVAGGLGDLTYSYSGLPPGCPSMNQSALLCVPSAVGVYPVQVNVTDQVGRWAVAATTLTVGGAQGSAPLLLTELLALPSTVTVGDQLTLAALAGGGSGPLSFTWTGLPPGCAPVNAPTVTCSPTTAGSYPIEAKISDPAADAVFGNLTVLVVPAPVVTPPPGPQNVTVTAVPNPATTGLLMAFTVAVSGGEGPLTYSFSGLPAGCAGGNVSTILCIPTTVGSDPVSVTITDALGRVSVGVVTAVVVAPSHSPPPMDNGSGAISATADTARLVSEAAIGVAVVAVAIALLGLMRRRPPASAPAGRR